MDEVIENWRKEVIFQISFYNRKNLRCERLYINKFIEQGTGFNSTLSKQADCRLVEYLPNEILPSVLHSQHYVINQRVDTYKHPYINMYKYLRSLTAVNLSKENERQSTPHGILSGLK